MAGEFVPLLNKASTDGAPSFRVRVVSGAPADSTFLPCPKPPPALPAAAAAPVNPAGSPHGEASVTLQREGDRIVGIRVQCGCGQVTELTCVY